jgi:excisionase family DNA binding protein
MQKLLTAQQVATILNLPLQRVYELTRRKAIPSVRVLRQYRYDPEALAEWAKHGGVTVEEHMKNEISHAR